MNAFRLALLGATACGSAAIPAQSLPVVVPADRAGLEGSASTSYPLGRYNARVQQLHSDIGTSARTIHGHAYRRDAISTHGRLNGFRVELGVEVSMSPRTPDTASRTFDDNSGAPVAVLPRSWVSFPTTERPGQAPAATFELRIPYTTPFPYPAGGGTVCIDTTVFGNDGPNGTNANFTAYLDAHEQFNNGSWEQPGYRYGQGCPPPSGGAAASASFELRWSPAGSEFEIQARNGVASTAGGPAMSALVTGFRSANTPFSLQPGCTRLVEPHALWPLSGANTSGGDWNGVLQGFAPLPVGLEFHAQVASGSPTGGLALSDASTIVVPPPGPQPVTAARVAHGSDRTSATGTVSLVVPVLELF